MKSFGFEDDAVRERQRVVNKCPCINESSCDRPRCTIIRNFALVFLVFLSLALVFISVALFSRVYFVPILGGCNITAKTLTTVHTVGESGKVKDNFVLRYYADFKIGDVFVTDKRLCHGQPQCFKSTDRHHAESTDCMSRNCNLEVTTSEDDLMKFDSVEIGSTKKCYYDPGHHKRAGYGFRRHSVASWAKWTIPFILICMIFCAVTLVFCVGVAICL